MICDLKSLRLLKKEFLALKEQAFKVSLYGIKPILGDDWTSLARDAILKFSEPDYYIACAFIEKINNSYFVCLCDTNSDIDVFIHNVLVDHKHAVFEDELLDQSLEFNESDEQIIGLFPFFLLITISNRFPNNLLSIILLLNLFEYYFQLYFS
jgi:hypothetical protein